MSADIDSMGADSTDADSTGADTTGWFAQTVVTDEESLARQQRFPVGAALTFEDMEAAGHEHRLDALRDAEPVSWVPAMGGWLVTSRELARTLLLPKSGGSVQADENLVRASTGTHMLTVDDPEHTRVREPFEVPFRAREAEARFATFIAEQTDLLLDAMTASGADQARLSEAEPSQAQSNEVELIEAFAAPFAVTVAAEVIGLPLGEVRTIDGIYTAFAEGMVYDGDPQRQINADAAREQLNGILLTALRRRREQPDGSLTSEVIANAGHLTDDEIVAQLRVVMFGAIETIQASVGNTVMYLLQHPEQLAQVRADRSLLAGAVDESIRLMPPVAFIERWMKSDLELGGVTIPRGEFIGISVIAANRDPETFGPDATEYDIRRDTARKALSFSGGEHHCLGVHLARMQTQLAIGRILDRFPTLELVELEPPAGFAFRKPGRLVIRWS